MSSGEELRANWAKIKDVLVPLVGKVKDITFQIGIIEIDDMERINKLQIEKDKIEMILLKVIQSKKADLFLESLQKSTVCDEVKTLCQEIQETEILVQTPHAIERSSTYIVSHTRATEDRPVRKTEDILEQALNKSLEKFAKEFEERQAKRDEAMLEMMTSKFSAIEFDRTKYNQLQTAYINAKDTIQQKIETLKEKNIENIELKKRIEQLTKEKEDLDLALEKTQTELDRVYQDLEIHKTENEELKQQKKSQFEETATKIVEKFEKMIASINRDESPRKHQHKQTRPPFYN